jgi:stearoyl-CoA desaturase (delta-9 desaturase)
LFQFALIFLASYLIHGFGVTIGYHRLLSHRSFRCPKWVEYFFVLSGYLAFEGSPIWWAAIHRLHHKYADLPEDPHRPLEGAWHSYMGWLFTINPAEVHEEVICKDLLKDPLYVFLEWGDEKLMFVINVLFRLVIWYFFGWVPALASLVAGICVFQIPLMLNLFCHISRLGYKNFATTDDGVNVWWIGVLALGEGWHNNHHAFPGSARTGLKAYELDLSWLVIRTLRFLRLARSVNDYSRIAAVEVNSVQLLPVEAERAERPRERVS